LKAEIIPDNLLRIMPAKGEAPISEQQKFWISTNPEVQQKFIFLWKNYCCP
jgi:hypothetical protein